jgi:hypothetical protein
MSQPTSPAIPATLTYDRVRWDLDHAPAEWEQIGHALTADARRAENEKAASFERCDTDGFLSQWASGVTAHADQLAASLARNHGLHEFAVLLNLDGSIASVHRGYGKWGAWWRLTEDAADRYGKPFLSEPNCKTNARDIASLARRGFRIGTMRARGRVKMGGGGTGLAGALSVRPYVELILPLAQAGHQVEVISQTSPWHEWMEDRDRQEAEHAAAEKAAARDQV